ncbi:receptor-interacting serine/threonine-protein kinase 1 [Rhinophrynus dorsalis]
MSMEDILMNSKDLIDQEDLDWGGFGMVSLCFHRKHGLVVLKTVFKGNKQEYNDALLEEGKIMHKLKHERVVKLLGFIIENCNYSLVMEYMKKGNLLTVLKQVIVPLSVKARFTMEIIEGMTYLHDEKVVHKDLKPGNILVDDDFHIKIADLGVASFKTWSTLTKEETVRQRRCKNRSSGKVKMCNAGTLIYMAPEHLKSLNAKSTEKSDVYSFAVVIWVIITNKEPYENALNDSQISICVINEERPDLAELPEDCPPEMLDLMQQCWKDNPDDRPTFKVCDQKFRPFYTQKQKKFVEKDVAKMKREFPEPKPFVQRMASLQLDCDAEPPSIQPRDQPHSLHSNHGLTTENPVNEALFFPNEPTEHEDEKQYENLERKLKEEMNYHQTGSRIIDNLQSMPSSHVLSASGRSRKVFNEASVMNPSPQGNSESVNGPFALNSERPPDHAAHYTHGIAMPSPDTYGSENRPGVYQPYTVDPNRTLTSKAAYDTWSNQARIPVPMSLPATLGHILLDEWKTPDKRLSITKRFSKLYQLEALVQWAFPPTMDPTVSRGIISMTPYLVDVFIKAFSEEPLAQHVQDCVWLLVSHRWILNMLKSSPVPSQELAFLGMRFNTHQGKVFLPDKKIFENPVHVSISNSSAVQIGNNNVLSIERENPVEDISIRSSFGPSYACYKQCGLFDCQTVVSEKHLHLLRENLSKKWKQFARKMGFREPEIDEIDHDYERDGLQEKVYQMLHKWQMKEGSKNATVGKVASALYDMGETELLNTLITLNENL